MRDVNAARFRPGQSDGHYESFFLRANHPARPLAFWIRYTVFSPIGRPQDAVGELWAIYFDGERRQHAAAKEVVPIDLCRFGEEVLDVTVGDARLSNGHAVGSARAPAAISWNLTFHGSASPILLLTEPMYEARLPRAKSLVPLPLAHFDGFLMVDGERIAVGDWVGSQNHNWGSRHTDLYAWGQVAGFDERPDCFLEVASARVKIGPLWTPMMSPMVLRRDGEEIALNHLLQTLRAVAAFDYFHWDFRSTDGHTTLEGRFEAPADAFVALRYDNPPGGTKTCLNSKLARCVLTITRDGRSERLTSAHRAAFEILTDDPRHGLSLRL